jgi:hypothetical protein
MSGQSIQTDDTPLDAAVIELPGGGTVPRGSAWRQLAASRWVVVGTLFLITGAPGLPLLWSSRAFSRGAKCGLTAAVLAWTGLLSWSFWLIMAWCYARLADALL